jgi:hypothetical protein
LEVYVDGALAGSGGMEFYPGEEGKTWQRVIHFDYGGALFAPNTDTPHVATALVTDSCVGVGQNFTFESLKIDVISVK